MVTHNPDLAEKYSSRIIKILDGKITDDSNPYNKEEEEKEDRTTKAMSGTIGYTKELTEHVINKINDAEIVQEQKENPDINVFTGIEFPEDTDARFDFSSLTDEQRMYMASLSEEELANLMQQYTENASVTYEGNLEKMGVVDLESPSAISIYPKDFESKDAIATSIENYNQKQRDEDKEENVITYTDLVGTMMSSVSTILFSYDEKLKCSNSKGFLLQTI